MRQLCKGNVAVVKGAVLAGCRAFYGYPITPASEIAEAAAQYIPQVGGTFLQAESEVSAINMVYGAASAGQRAMTASSGPGLSLMQEGISYMAGAELPAVIVDVVRGGPGLGNIAPEQSDYFCVVKGGGHGNYHNFVVAPASVQEMCDLTILAFDLADRYRNPAVVLTDGFVGQMMEPLDVDPVEVPQPEKPWAVKGTRETQKNLITSIFITPDELEAHQRKLEAKYKVARELEPRHETYYADDAEVLLVGYGIVSRVLRSAVEHARQHGLRVGLFRPITLWPYPSKALAEAAARVRTVLTVELSNGQMVEDVRLAVDGRIPVEFYAASAATSPPSRKFTRNSWPALRPWSTEEETVSDFQVLHSKSKVFYDRYERKPELQHQTHYCPGCGHGVVHKLIAETLADMKMQENTIFVSPVGCSVFAYYYFDVGNVQVAHGRAPAAATALKRAFPDKLVISYQGDGDLAAIGTAEIIHAANRGENISVFFVNNAIYGMTGGQMAPTTLVGQYATTAPWGRRANNEGFPLHVAELLSTLEAPVYIERVSLHDPKNVMKARKAVRKALDLQKQGAGFTLVELLSPCPTIWKMDPAESRKWIAENMLPVFPLNVFRDRRPEIKPVMVPRLPIAEAIELQDAVAPVETHSRRNRNVSVKIAGFGGQGVLLLGQIMAEMGMREGLEVSWLPSYGPEMRSGSAHCHVNLCNERIGSPLISHPDVLIAMNELSLRKFASEVAPGGLIFYNRDKLPADFTPPNARVICIPASEMADQMGTAKVANIVLLGAVLAETEALSEETAVNVLETKVKKAKILELDLQALRQGREFVQKQVEVGALSQPDGCGY